MGKRLVDRKQTYRITGTRGKAEFVGQRCRFVLPEDVMEINTDEQGFAADLDGYMLSGKWFNSTVALPPCKFKPVDSIKCHCNAYPFGHAPGLGQCKGSAKESIAPSGLESLDRLFASLKGSDDE